MRHLRKSTKIKMLGMKGDPAFSGANWEEVTRSLPSYAHVLDEKKKNASGRKMCCTIGRREVPLGTAMSNKIKQKSPKYARVNTNPRMNDEHSAPAHMTRFGITSKSYGFLPPASALMAAEKGNAANLSDMSLKSSENENGQENGHETKEDGDVTIAMTSVKDPTITKRLDFDKCDVDENEDEANGNANGQTDLTMT